MILEHGTTRRRAELIAANGPDSRFREPGEQSTRHDLEFSTCRPGYSVAYIGDPEHYARLKSVNFPDEGGPTVLRMDVPDDVIACTDTILYPPEYGLVVFDQKHGIEVLRDAMKSGHVETVLRNVPWPNSA